MELLLTNGILRDSLSVKAQELASEKDWDEVNRGLFSGYEEILSGFCAIDKVNSESEAVDSRANSIEAS